jgi:hypothetical protein
MISFLVGPGIVVQGFRDRFSMSMGRERGRSRQASGSRRNNRIADHTRLGDIVLQSTEKSGNRTTEMVSPGRAIPKSTEAVGSGNRQRGFVARVPDIGYRMRGICVRQHDLERARMSRSAFYVNYERIMAEDTDEEPHVGRLIILGEPRLVFRNYFVHLLIPTLLP